MEIRKKYCKKCKSRTKHMVQIFGKLVTEHKKGLKLLQLKTEDYIFSQCIKCNEVTQEKEWRDYETKG